MQVRHNERGQFWVVSGGKFGRARVLVSSPENPAGSWVGHTQGPGMCSAQRARAYC